MSKANGAKIQALLRRNSMRRRAGYLQRLRKEGKV